MALSHWIRIAITRIAPISYLANTPSKIPRFPVSANPERRFDNVRFQGWCFGPVLFFLEHASAHGSYADYWTPCLATCSRELELVSGVFDESVLSASASVQCDQSSRAGPDYATTNLGEKFVASDLSHFERVLAFTAKP